MPVVAGEEAAGHRPCAEFRAPTRRRDVAGVLRPDRAGHRTRARRCRRRPPDPPGPRGLHVHAPAHAHQHHHDGARAQEGAGLRRRRRRAHPGRFDSRGAAGRAIWRRGPVPARARRLHAVPERPAQHGAARRGGAARPGPGARLARCPGCGAVRPDRLRDPPLRPATPPDPAHDPATSAGRRRDCQGASVSGASIHAAT
jgi:hypothetical protein